MIKAEGWCGGAEGGARGRTGGGVRELTQQPLVLALDASHLVAGEGVVLTAPACTAPAAGADGGTARTGDKQHPVHLPACTQPGWRLGGTREEDKNKTQLIDMEMSLNPCSPTDVSIISYTIYHNI